MNGNMRTVMSMTRGVECSLIAGIRATSRCCVVRRQLRL
jgi:hypothetical protein